MAKKKGGKKRPSAQPVTKKADPGRAETKQQAAPAPAEATSDAPEPQEDEADEAPPPPSVPGEEAEPPVDPHPPKPRARQGAPWGEPLAKLERALTWFEIRLLVSVILLLIASMMAWVSVVGLSSPLESQDSVGTIYRGFVGAFGLAAVAWFVSSKLQLDKKRSSLLGLAGVIIGFVLAGSWRGVGVEYFGHVKNWVQEGSTLTMFGGLRGTSTRLTILLAFVGGSLAAASGKHINIDVALRFVTPKMKLPVFVIQNLATVAFCVVAAVGFFEYIAISNFNAKVETTRSEKLSLVTKTISQDLFLMRRQIGFDLRAAPYVLGGSGRWDDEGRLDGKAWNQYIETSGYRDYFEKEQVDMLLAPPDALSASRVPLAIGPEGQPRNVLIRTMNLTFAVGFLFMGLRFLLRMLLVLSGHTDIDPEPEYDPEDDPKRHAEREKVEREIAKEAA